MAKQLTTIINQPFVGLIWKLETDTENDLIYIEIRNEKEHSAGFSSLNLKTGKLNFLELVPEEKWLVGLSGGRKGILFLHGYLSDQTPEHKAIIALDGTTGKQLWANYNLSLETFTEKGLLAADQRFQSKRLVLMDEQTGNLKTGINLDDLADDVQPIQIPQMLLLLPQNLSALITGTITGGISCFNYNTYLIISLHTQNHGELLQQLFVVENEAIIYQDLLNEQIQKLQPEAFVMIKNYLVYLKNKTVLKVLNLEQ
ncbi:DUF4905 domain-containing protein [uncultured Mucilaginibacter sp.]|uniref:DUF4905 domain-containing protein n=1 Tax=uncultured Mucilaginibacter sp. TaxID=797541 RepID=UPI002609CCDA|nr:DUF4905 domain-containing protein [uncultured Mucilaginibacter sp.]